MLLTNIALVIAAIMGAGIIFVGVRFHLVPRAASSDFGVASDPDNRYLSVKGIRDIATGLFGFMLIIAGDPVIVGWYLIVACVIPIGDAVIVLRAGGSRAAAYGIHGATAAFMVTVGLILVLA